MSTVTNLILATVHGTDAFRPILLKNSRRARGGEKAPILSKSWTMRVRLDVVGDQNCTATALSRPMFCRPNFRVEFFNRIGHERSAASLLHHPNADVARSL